MEKHAVAIMIAILGAFGLVVIAMLLLKLCGGSSPDGDGDRKWTGIGGVHIHDGHTDESPASQKRDVEMGHKKVYSSAADRSGVPFGASQDIPAAPPELQRAAEPVVKAEQRAWEEFNAGYHDEQKVVMSQAFERERQEKEDELWAERLRKETTWRKFAARWRRYLDMGGKQPGSFGIPISGNDPASGEYWPCKIADVKAGEAGSRARVSRADGGELPEAERCLKRGDLIIKVAVPASRGAGAKGSHYGDDTWPIFHRSHLLVAVGQHGHVWEGSDISLYVVRDKEFIKQWAEAVRKFWQHECKFAKMLDPWESPFSDSPPMPPGFSFPKPPDHLLLKADITMSQMSEKSKQIRIDQLRQLKKKVPRPEKLDVDFLFEMQRDSDEAKAECRVLFDRYDTNKNGRLELDEMQKLHAGLADRCGLPPLEPEEVAAEFDEADVNSDGKLSFDEFYFYLRDQILESMFRTEERHDIAQGSMYASRWDPSMADSRMAGSAAGMGSSKQIGGR
eukprot:TRINITY_DN65058_c0_g1_i1.p1 TRINITY_DN65058_c0_g1~~TRINITY_DN65058_c0_g1_i1.p1  ORF type:complete len:539 (+),score=162.41 TRINITY_DN65058_c0_g1_i1:98-1618(+)